MALKKNGLVSTFRTVYSARLQEKIIFFSKKKGDEKMRTIIIRWMREKNTFVYVDILDGRSRRQFVRLSPCMCLLSSKALLLKCQLGL